MPGIVLKILHLFFPILTTTFIEENKVQTSKNNKKKNSWQADFEGQASSTMSVFSAHSPSPPLSSTSIK